MTPTNTLGHAALTPAQLGTLRAAVDRIIPADDYPSGWEAGVGDFLIGLMAREPQFLPVYQAGLDAVEAEAHVGGGGPFADMGASEQDALLARLEAAHWSFFRLLVRQAMEGFYADPGNGGNKGGVAWDMIGYKVTA